MLWKFDNIYHVRLFFKTENGESTLLFMYLHGFLSSYLKLFKVKVIAGQSLSWLQWILTPHAAACKTAAFQLIVISLSQGELSRDRAHTEQFSSPPIQTDAIGAQCLNGGKGADRKTGTKSDRHRAELRTEGDKSRFCISTDSSVLCRPL